MGHHIQRLAKENSTCLERLAPDVFDNAIDPTQLIRFLDDPRHIMVVAIEDELVVGMASGVEYFHPDKPPQMWINEIGVSPEYQRRGMGRKLVAALIDVARHRGCIYVWLGTEHNNKPAQACFGSVPGAEQPKQFLLYEWDLEE